VTLISLLRVIILNEQHMILEDPRKCLSLPRRAHSSHSYNDSLRFLGGLRHLLFSTVQWIV
jgi:hypothetical protein